MRELGSRDPETARSQVGRRGAAPGHLQLQTAMPHRTEADTAGGADWGAVLELFVEGDRAACAQVRQMIMTMVVRSRAFDLASLWEDMCQNVLVTIVRTMQRGGLRKPSAFAGYCSSVVRHEVGLQIEQVRRQRSRRDEVCRDVRPVLRISSDMCLDIYRAVESLPARHRAVVKAIYIDGHSYEDASQSLAIPMGTLKRVQTQAVKLLRARLLAPAKIAPALSRRQPDPRGGSGSGAPRSWDAPRPGDAPA